MQIESITQSQVVSKLLNQSGISYLTKEDILHIKQLHPNSEPGGSYADTWCYLTQAAHMENCNAPFGLKFSKEETIIVLGVFKRPSDPYGRQHVHLIHPSGHWNHLMMHDLARVLNSVTGTPVYVKKIDAKQFQSLQSLGFVDANTFPWHDIANVEDDTFPEIVISLDALEQSIEDGGDTEINRKYGKLHRTHGFRFRFLPYRSDEEQAAFNIVHEFFSPKYPVHGSISDPSDYKNMIKLCSLVDPTLFGILSWIIYLDNTPIGFFVSERTSHNHTAGIYASIVLHQDSKDIGQGISEFIWTTCLLKLREHGFKFANLGGSETRGLASFKDKFGRVADGHPHQMYWAVWAEDRSHDSHESSTPRVTTIMEKAPIVQGESKATNTEVSSQRIHEGPKVQAVLIFINVIMGISLWQALVALQLTSEQNTFMRLAPFALVLANLLRTFLGFVSFEMNKGLSDYLTRTAWCHTPPKDKQTYTGKNDNGILQGFRLVDFVLGMAAGTLMVPLSQNCGRPSEFVIWFFVVSVVFVIRNGILWLFYFITKGKAQVEPQDHYKGDIIINPLIVNLEMVRFWFGIDSLIVVGAFLMMEFLNIPEIFTIGCWSALTLMLVEMFIKRRYYFAGGTLDKVACPEDHVEH